MARGSAGTVPAWPWPIDLARYDRRPELTEHERAALTSLGWEVRRRRGYAPDRVEWPAISRLLRPLDDARAAAHPRRDARSRRRSRALGRDGGALARHLDAHAEGPRRVSVHRGQGRPVAGRRAPRDRRTRTVDPRDLRGLGRGTGPDDRRRARAA